MKKFLLLMATAMLAMSLSAAPVDQATAFRKAKSFLSNKLYAGKLMGPEALNPVLLKAEMGGKINEPVYYIYNTSTTFLVIAGDDRAEEVLMIGDAPLNDINNLPLGMLDMLDQYKNEIMYLQEHPGLVVQPIVGPQLSPSLRGSDSGGTYLLDCNWDQDRPYYNQCKFTYNGSSYQCLTGCPATSAAMVMYYWQFPTTATPTVPGYTTSLNDTYSLYIDPLPSTTFDWANMRASYTNGYTTAQGDAVATLMRYVGQAEKMDYGTSGSGISAYNSQNVADMFKLFGYEESTTRLVRKNNIYTGQTLYSDSQWASLIQTEINQARPIVFMAQSNSGGHAFNVDGYNSSTNKYHCNFGWSGYGNAWCALNAFNYGSDSYSQWQQMIIGIQPGGTDPIITVDPAELTFSGCYANESYNKTFVVKGRNLTNNITLSVSGAGYTVSPTTISKSEAPLGVTVTVNYKPTELGTTTATITASSSGAESKTVPVTGICVERPALKSNKSSLSFNATVGETATKTLRVTGTNVIAPVYLSVSGSGFSVSPTQITAANVMTTYGTTVTVSYKPTTAGTHTGTLTITTADAQPVTVALDGTASDNNPIINVNPATLSFSGETGQSYTKTFNVTGANLTGDLTLTLNNANGIYSINKTSITASEAANGAAVIVTYSPTAAGNSAASVTISGGGAASQTVNLSGAATEPARAISVDPSSLTFAALVDEVVTKTFTVTGTNLNGNLTLAVNGANGVYSVTPTTITAAEAAAGKTVNVTYSPTAAGNHNATVTVSGGGADSKTVTLNGTATEPVRTITATPSSLTFNNIIGETTSQTFIVTGQNLKGSNLTLNLNDQNGVFSIEPTTITLAEAAAGKIVTVNYAPEAFGNHSATITISGGSANPVTVTLAGQANITKYAPVMLEPNDLFVAIDRFRAEWMDQTPVANVASYTLEVNAKVVEPVLLHTLNGSDFSGGYGDVTFTAPWGGTNLRKGTGVVYFRNNYNGANSPGNITYTVPEGYNNATFTMRITTGNSNDGVGNLAVGTPQTASVNHYFTAGATYSWLVTASAGEMITITTTDANYSPDIAKIEVYAGDATAAALMASETGGPNYRLITEIDPENKFYTVENLTAGGTFLYRVKALYIDGTESDWSNIEEVTLHENAHPYQLGDVNHDTFINVSDVTALIAHILGTNDAACPLCGDMDGNQTCNVADVTALISLILNGGGSNNAPAMPATNNPK